MHFIIMMKERVKERNECLRFLSHPHSGTEKLKILLLSLLYDVARGRDGERKRRRPTKVLRVSLNLDTE